jgi:hypothetical protein
MQFGRKVPTFQRNNLLPPFSGQDDRGSRFHHWYLSTKLHDVTSKMTIILTLTAVRTSILINWLKCNYSKVLSSLCQTVMKTPISSDCDSNSTYTLFYLINNDSWKNSPVLPTTYIHFQTSYWTTIWHVFMFCFHHIWMDVPLFKMMLNIAFIQVLSDLHPKIIYKIMIENPVTVWRTVECLPAYTPTYVHAPVRICINFVVPLHTKLTNINQLILTPSIYRDVLL